VKGEVDPRVRGKSRQVFTHQKKMKKKSPQKAKTLRNLIPDEAELVRIINFLRFLIGE
jgi:hypothetical protein